LRDHKEDIPALANHFLERYARESAKPITSITPAAMKKLMDYHWPGNVRELENCIERAVILSGDGVIHSHQLPPSLQTAEESDTPPLGKLPAALETVEREMIDDALKSSRGNMAAAARLLGISERLIGIRIRKYGIDPNRFADSDPPGRTPAKPVQPVL